MSIFLGNLSVTEIQTRAGVEFPAELIEWMNQNKQESASNIKPGLWHCFDIPFFLACGDMETAVFVYSHLKELSSSFKEVMNIGIQE